ncbi:MAG: hypothetical protein M1835_003775, partial [Candelina submexicana]
MSDNFVGPQPAAVFGKRKRETRSSLAASSDDAPISGQDDRPEAVFRRHFEAQFEPLEKSIIEAEALQVAAQSRESSIGDDESDWNGLSDSEDGSTIEIVEHIMTNGARRNKLSKEELKSFMTPKPPSTNPTPLSAIKRQDLDLSNASEAATDASNLRKDLALQ